MHDTIIYGLYLIGTLASDTNITVLYIVASHVAESPQKCLVCWKVIVKVLGLSIDLHACSS